MKASTRVGAGAGALLVAGAAGAVVRAIGKEKRGYTRIAGTVLKYYRSSRGVTQDDLAKRINRQPSRVSKAEGGVSRLRFFRETIGDIGHYLELGSAEIVAFMSALWVDELLADLVALTPRPDVEKRSSCFALLQWLWFHPDARTWLKVIFFSNLGPHGAGPVGVAEGACLLRHPAFQTPWNAEELPESENHDRSKGGAVHESPYDALTRSVLVGPHAADKLGGAVRNAQMEAITILQKPSKPGPAPKVADMLLLFADLANREAESRTELRHELEALSKESLSPIDSRYRARALYLLGDDFALCELVRALNVPEHDRDSTLQYYAEQAGDQGDGTLTLDSLCSHVVFAWEKKSAPLLALYLATTEDLIASKRTSRRWSRALGNLSTTRTLNATLKRILREFDHVDRRAFNQAAPNWADHSCADDESNSDLSTCRRLATASAERIRRAINEARIAMRAHGTP